GAEASASNASAPVRAPPSGSPSTPAPNALLSAAEPKSVRIARGARLVREFECARCHAGSGAPTPPLHKQCVGCHQSILGGDYAITDSATGQRREASKADLREWQSHIVHLRHVPDLGQLGQTLREDWLARYLLNPQDLRPALPASMPRFALSAQQAQDIAAYLTRDAIPSGNTRAPIGGASKQEIADGRRLFGSAGCAGCHALTGADVSPPKAVRDPRFLAPEALLAPDLRFARERFLAGKFEQWLSQPRQLRSAALMPPHRVSAEDARKLRAFVWSSPLRATPVAALPAALPLLTRPVTFDEVNREVFRKVCWHCHSQPDFARGDGGPGMTGGFGFKGRKHDLS